MSDLLLFVGDLHLGRRPLRIPEGQDATMLGPEEAWRRTVELALREEVAAVLLAGDVVESLEDRFEAERRLRPGVELLLDAGIRVLAIAGNHDVHALPRLATLVPGFELIGRGGWESRVIADKGRPFCRVHGWSFESPIERENPLLTLQPEHLDPSLANIGLIHCDRDAPASRHAPVAAADFNQAAAAALDAVFLGHIHKPDHSALRARRPVGYLGSLVGLDPGEPGRHGPWLVQVLGRGQIKARQVPVGPLRWERRDLDLNLGGDDDFVGGDAADCEDELARRIRVAMIALHEELGADADSLEALGLRIRLVGRVGSPQLIADTAKRFAVDGQPLEALIGGCRYYCEKVESAVLPLIDLDELARGPGALASLAGIISRLERSDCPDPPSLPGLEDELDRLLSRRSWADLPILTPGEAAGSERVTGAARALLARMLDQPERES